MKSCHLTFLSKNKKSLDNSFFFFFYDSIFNFNVVKKHFQKKNKKHFLTILKSPHVNKKAQEQFESHIFSKQLSVYSLQKFKYLFFFKKVQTNIFSNVQLKIKFSINKNKNHDEKSKNFDLNNFYININKNNISQKNDLKIKKNVNKLKYFNTKNIEKVKNFVKIVDIYGELHNFNKKVSLDSSVGRAKD